MHDTTALDCLGHRWNLKLTLARVAAIGDACGLDIFSEEFCERLNTAGAPNILHCAYALASPECARLGLTRADFLDRFQGGAEVVALMQAARVSLQLFFRTFAPRPPRRANVTDAGGAGATRTVSPRSPKWKISHPSRCAN